MNDRFYTLVCYDRCNSQMQCKLRPLEALCVAGAVEDGLDRLRVLQSLTPQVITQRDELSNILGETVAQIIEKQKKCEERYQKLVKKRSELKSLSNKTRYKKNQEKIETQARELQDLTRDLCKRLRESPNVSENLLKIQNERSSLISLFESFRNELLTNKSFTGIAQSTAMRKSNYENMMNVMQTDREMQHQIEELNASIQRTEAEMQHRCEALDAQIKEQKEILIQRQTDSDAVKAQRDDERNARIEAMGIMNKLSQSKLTQQMKNAKMQLENEHRVHDETLQYFARRRGKIAEMTQSWTEKYDRENTDRTRELKSLTDRIESATNEFSVLKPKKEESEKLLKLETVRSQARAKQSETYAEQESFMNKVKIIYMLHARVRPPLPKPKGKRKKK